MNRAFQFASLTVIVIAFIKIVFLLEFWVIPTAFFCAGLIAALAHQRFSLYLFLFLFPFINSSPELFKTDYPFNYIAPALFLLGGMVTAEIVKRLKSHKSGAGSQAPHSEGSDQGFFFYHLFLILLVISTFFVFLSWSNIGLPGIGALGADTPAAPETPFSPLPPEPQRISFASIFPVVTLFIYFISPFIFFYIKKEAALPFLDELERLPGGQNDNEAENTCFWCRLLNSMKKKQRSREADIFKWLSFGFYISVALAVMQKISGRSMISDRLGKELKQFYGGFSDFNAFGFFSGVMFLWSTYQVKNKNLLGYITFAVSLGGTVLSG
ncbi:MAG: hypothetical protein L0Y73_02985, partial [Candidatus Aminicenantes bacterium]|nr:hypothetical protein [Candidatus Aminicenantes bacterium]